jgi:hypothetical protein
MIDVQLMPDARPDSDNPPVEFVVEVVELVADIAQFLSFISLQTAPVWSRLGTTELGWRERHPSFTLSNY